MHCFASLVVIYVHYVAGDLDMADCAFIGRYVFCWILFGLIAMGAYVNRSIIFDVLRFFIMLESAFLN